MLLLLFIVFLSFCYLLLLPLFPPPPLLFFFFLLLLLSSASCFCSSSNPPAHLPRLPSPLLPFPSLLSASLHFSLFSSFPLPLFISLTPLLLFLPLTPSPPPVLFFSLTTPLHFLPLFLPLTSPPPLLTLSSFPPLFPFPPHRHSPPLFSFFFLLLITSSPYSSSSFLSSSHLSCSSFCSFSSCSFPYNSCFSSSSLNMKTRCVEFSPFASPGHFAPSAHDADGSDNGCVEAEFADGVCCGQGRLRHCLRSDHASSITPQTAASPTSAGVIAQMHGDTNKHTHTNTHPSSRHISRTRGRHPLAAWSQPPNAAVAHDP